MTPYNIYIYIYIIYIIYIYIYIIFTFIYTYLYHSYIYIHVSLSLPLALGSQGLLKQHWQDPATLHHGATSATGRKQGLDSGGIRSGRHGLPVVMVIHESSMTTG